MTKEIILTKGYVALVDDEDFEWLNQWKWKVRFGGSINAKPSAVRNLPRKNGNRHQSTISMHRQILDAPPERLVDHRNGNTLDNQRSNLRLATPQQNSRNRGANIGSVSQYVGVVWHKRSQKWQAQIRIREKLHYLGLFTDECSAARAYDIKAREFFGEFAHCNLPEAPV